jgi:hypothetical protein
MNPNILFDAELRYTLSRTDGNPGSSPRNCENSGVARTVESISRGMTNFMDAFRSVQNTILNTTEPAQEKQVITASTAVIPGSPGIPFVSKNTREKTCKNFSLISPYGVYTLKKSRAITFFSILKITISLSILPLVFAANRAVSKLWITRVCRSVTATVRKYAARYVLRAGAETVDALLLTYSIQRIWLFRCHYPSWDSPPLATTVRKRRPFIDPSPTVNNTNAHEC